MCLKLFYHCLLETPKSVLFAALLCLVALRMMRYFLNVLVFSLFAIDFG